MTRASDEQALPEFSVYSGQDWLGHAVEQPPGCWSAYTAEDRPLGTFPTRRAAADAISAAAGGMRPNGIPQ
jgi:hypothetical protein